MGQARIDLRSDTVTRPTPAMRKAMYEAEVGDDVLGDDPTVKALEEAAAAAVGHEAALFVPSGTMGNQVSINVHVRSGQEVVLDRECHIANYELAGIAAWSGAMPRSYVGPEGIPAAVQLASCFRSGHPYYEPRTGLIALENTHLDSGGVPHAPAAFRHVLQFAAERGIPVHLDGARLFNAAVALRVPARELAVGFSSVMFCFSKGLGAPVGSCIAGSRTFIEEARKVRKRMGGGMRQAGVLAAAALHALKHHVDRLAEDHARARRLAEGIAEIPGWSVAPMPPPTNIVMARPPGADAERACERLAEAGLLTLPEGGRVRLVTHLDVNDAAVEGALAILRTTTPAL